MEIELRAQVVARSEMLEMQKSLDAQIKEHANTNSKLKVLLTTRFAELLEIFLVMQYAGCLM